MDKVIHDIAHGDNAAKRLHNTIVHTGHKVHPSKSQRMTTEVEPPPSNTAPLIAATFGDMVSQTIKKHKKSAYTDAKVVEGQTPFSPIGRGIMSYDVSNTLPEEEDDSDWNTKGKGKGKSKSKNKAKGKKRPAKDPQYMVIPAYGTAMAPYAIKMFPITSFTDAGHPYQVRVPTPM